MARAAKEKVLTITWRNEGYGRVSEDSVAFRTMLEPFPSQTESTKLSRLYKKCGFELNFNRQSWIAEFKPADTPVRLVETLKDAGYTVVNVGAVPDILNKAKAEVAPEAPDEAPAPRM